MIWCPPLNGLIVINCPYWLNNWLYWRTVKSNTELKWVFNVNVCMYVWQGSPSQGAGSSTLQQYRSTGGAGVGDQCPQSPTSPLSQPSYSPSQSPGLPPTAANPQQGPPPPPQGPAGGFNDAYYMQQAAQTQALQHQFEQFSMVCMYTSRHNGRLCGHILMSVVLWSICVTDPRAA